MAEPVRAKDVIVAKFWQAMCNRPGCGEQGDLAGTYQEANDWRLEHLDEHRTLLIHNPAFTETGP